MNYLKVYCNLIRKAENRTPPEGYTEKHHIFPVSIFGNNTKIVILTGREHYIAHALLEKVYIKRYGLDDIKTKKMITAFWCMNSQKSKNEYLNSYLYEYSKIRFVNSIKGRKFTEEQKNDMSRRHSERIWWTDGVNTKHSKECPGDGWYRGRPNNNVGRVMSEEAKRKISQKNKGRKLTEKQKEIISKQVSKRRWWNNGEVDKHTIECPGDDWVLGRLYTKNREITEEFREKCRQQNIGRKISEETRKKLSNIRRGKKLTEEHKKKIGEASKKLGIKPPSSKGKKWWNNGIKSKLSFECPGEGWVRGRCPVVKVS